MALCKPCLCGSKVERHQSKNGKWFVYCSDCQLAFGIELGICETLDPQKVGGMFDTAEQAKENWNNWISNLKNEEDYLC